MNANILLWTGVAIVAASIFVAKRAKATNILEPEADTDNKPPADGVYLTPPAGFRRAKQSEVTPAISAMAKESLSYPMGTLRGPFTNENGVQYYIAVETHSNKPKGSSVFIAV